MTCAIVPQKIQKKIESFSVFYFYRDISVISVTFRNSGGWLPTGSSSCLGFLKTPALDGIAECLWEQGWTFQQRRAGEGGEQPPWSEIANYDHIYFHYGNVVFPLHIAYIVQFFPLGCWRLGQAGTTCGDPEIRLWWNGEREEMEREWGNHRSWMNRSAAKRGPSCHSQEPVTQVLGQASPHFKIYNLDFVALFCFQSTWWVTVALIWVDRVANKPGCLRCGVCRKLRRVTGCVFSFFTITRIHA